MVTCQSSDMMNDPEVRYIIFMSLKKGDKIEDIPIQGFTTDYEATIFLEGYVHAIINHTGDADYADVKGQFSIRDVAGQEVGLNNKNKEAKNGKND